MSVIPFEINFAFSKNVAMTGAPVCTEAPAPRTNTISLTMFGEWGQKWPRSISFNLVRTSGSGMNFVNEVRRILSLITLQK